MEVVKAEPVKTEPAKTEQPKKAEPKPAEQQVQAGGKNLVYNVVHLKIVHKQKVYKVALRWRV